MKKLYLKIKDQTIPIEDVVAEKYKLYEGAHSPFTGFLIVGATGHAVSDVRENQREDKDIPVEPEGLFSVSEAIDIASGADSYE